MYTKFDNNCSDDYYVYIFSIEDSSPEDCVLENEFDIPVFPVIRFENARKEKSK